MKLRNLPTAKLRVLSTVLWFFAGWYVANFAVAFFGASTLIGPIVGIAAAVLIGGDPFHLLWTTRPTRTAGGSTFASESTRS